MALETMAPVSDNPIVMLSALPGAWSAQTDAEIGGGSDKVHHAGGHDLRRIISFMADLAHQIAAFPQNHPDAGFILDFRGALCQAVRADAEPW